MQQLNQQKLALVELLLPLCPFLAVDGTHPGVVVPAGCTRTDLVLRIGRDPRVLGMPDLELTKRGFSGTMSFNRGQLFVVFVPWEAVSRGWIGDPFEGPIFVWPPVAQASGGCVAQAPQKERPRLQVVRSSAPPPDDGTGLPDVS